MKCAKSCGKYDAWLEPKTDWQAPNPCDGCLDVGVANCLDCIENGAKND